MCPHNLDLFVVRCHDFHICTYSSYRSLLFSLGGTSSSTPTCGTSPSGRYVRSPLPGQRPKGQAQQQGHPVKTLQRRSRRKAAQHRLLLQGRQRPRLKVLPGTSSQQRMWPACCLTSWLTPLLRTRGPVPRRPRPWSGAGPCQQLVMRRRSQSLSPGAAWNRYGGVRGREVCVRGCCRCRHCLVFVRTIYRGCPDDISAGLISPLADGRRKDGSFS